MATEVTSKTQLQTISGDLATKIGSFKNDVDSMKSTLDSIGVISWYRTYEVFIINSTLMNYILDYTDFDERDLPIYYIALNYQLVRLLLQEKIYILMKQLQVF